MAGWTMGIDAWIWMAAWALVMVLVVWLLVREPRRESHEEPGAIIRDRFARGEISEAEYKRAAAALEADPPSVPNREARLPTRHARQGQEVRHDRP